MEVSPVGVGNGLPEIGVKPPVVGLTVKAEMVLAPWLAAYRKAGVWRDTVTEVVPLIVPLLAEICAVPGPRVFPMPIRPPELFTNMTAESLEDHVKVCVRSCVLPSVNL